MSLSVPVCPCPCLSVCLPSQHGHSHFIPGETPQENGDAVEGKGTVYLNSISTITSDKSTLSLDTNLTTSQVPNTL